MILEKYGEPFFGEIDLSGLEHCVRFGISQIQTDFIELTNGVKSLDLAIQS